MRRVVLHVGEMPGSVSMTTETADLPGIDVRTWNGEQWHIDLTAKLIARLVTNLVVSLAELSEVGDRLNS